MKQLFNKHLFQHNTLYWLLLTLGYYFNMGKVEYIKKVTLLWVRKIFTEEPWRKKYIKKMI